VAALFIPISLLRALSIVDFPGGRGLLVMTDFDTLYVDATIAVSLLLLYRNRGTARRQLPLVVFLVLLAGLTTITLAYVVTNFGTLFRLRLLAVVPLWALVLAIRGSFSGAPAPVRTSPPPQPAI
jgi:hypothetical protein